MIISIPVSDTLIRAAKDRNMTVEEFVESLIDKGMEASTGRPILSDAIERIRSLRTEVIGAGSGPIVPHSPSEKMRY